MFTVRTKQFVNEWWAFGQRVRSVSTKTIRTPVFTRWNGRVACRQRQNQPLWLNYRRARNRASFQSRRKLSAWKIAFFQRTRKFFHPSSLIPDWYILSITFLWILVRGEICVSLQLDVILLANRFQNSASERNVLDTVFQLGRNTTDEETNTLMDMCRSDRSSHAITAMTASNKRLRNSGTFSIVIVSVRNYK